MAATLAADEAPTVRLAAPMPLPAEPLLAEQTYAVVLAGHALADLPALSPQDRTPYPLLPARRRPRSRQHHNTAQTTG